MADPFLFCFVGPAGSGKSSICAGLLKRDLSLMLSVSTTTRKPREGEVDGEHYFFVSAEEFEKRVPQRVYLSATPAKYEHKHTKKDRIVEQIIRPTGLLDPPVSIHPTKGQVAHITKEIDEAIKRKERVLITTLTKKSAEDLSQFLLDENYKVKYLKYDWTINQQPPK